MINRRMILQLRCCRKIEMTRKNFPALANYSDSVRKKLLAFEVLSIFVEISLYFSFDDYCYLITPDLRFEVGAHQPGDTQLLFCLLKTIVTLLKL